MIEITSMRTSDHIGAFDYFFKKKKKPSFFFISLDMALITKQFMWNLKQAIKTDYKMFILHFYLYLT